MTRIVDYKTPVTIQKPRAAVSGDSFNQPDYQDADNWIDLFERRANVRPAGGREFISGSQTNAEVSHLVRMRHDPETKDIVPPWRLRIGQGVSARYLDIVRAVDVDERHWEIELQCLERVA